MAEWGTNFNEVINFRINVAKLQTSPSFCVICFAEMGCRRNIKKIDDTVGVVKERMKDLITDYKILINETLPATYQSPVRFNHCFNRIILDWLFQDCWYNHLDRRKTAISQLSETQVQRALQRMNEWMMNHQLLIEDNINSLRWRKKITNKNQIK